MTGIDVITVRDAARGDGIQDDAPPFTKAISAATAKGGALVFVDFGTYKLNAMVTVPAGVTVLISAGATFTGTGYLSVTGGSVVNLRNGLTTTGQSASFQNALDLARNNGGNAGSMPQKVFNADSIDSYDIQANVDSRLNALQLGGMVGKYAWLLPYGPQGVTPQSVMAVYDTTKPFNVASSWQAIDLHTATGFNTAEGFLGMCTLKNPTDNSVKVYLVPKQTANQAGSIGSIVGNAHFFMYDSAKGLPTETAAWSHFNGASSVAAMIAGRRGWAMACSDMRYVYYCPVASTNGAVETPHGLAVRYDTTLPFTEAGSWQTINLPGIITVSGGCGGFQGIVFTGKHIYYTQTSNGSIGDTIVRFNITGNFTDNADGAWESVNLTSLTFTNAAQCSGFVECGFVGNRYLMLSPWQQMPGAVTHGWVTILDTLAAATLATSDAAWATFNLTTVNSRCKGYQGVWEAGDFVYLLPTNAGDGTPPPFIRWDKRKPFATSTSWETVTPATAPPWMTGGAHDGTYFYGSSLRELGGDPSPGTFSGRIFRVYSPDYPAGQSHHSLGDGYALFRDVGNNIGINTLSPSFPLDVAGTANATALRTPGFLRVFGTSTNTHGAFADIKGWEEVVTIASGTPTTDTATNIPAGVLVVGVSVRVNVQPPNTATFTVTGATSATAYNTGTNVSSVATTTDPGTKAGVPYNGAAQKVRLTMNANPTDTTGRVVVNVHYIQITPPTS